MKIRKYLILVFIILITTSQSFTSYGLESFETNYVSLVQADDYNIKQESSMKEITIFHTNDIHGRYAQGNNHIQIGNLATLKKETPNSILVDAGDCLHGLPLVNMNKGKEAIELMKIAGYNYVTPGNHDFNYGKERLIELSQMASTGDNKLKFLSSNIVENEDTILDSNDIKEVDGVKIGFFGLTTQETESKTGLKNIKDLKFINPIESAKNQVKELKENGANIIVAIAHIGTNSQSNLSSLDIANKVDGIDLIVDGHSHTKFDNGKKIGNTLIVSTGQYLENIGEVKLTIDTKDKDNIKVNNKVARLIGKEEALKYKQDSSVDDKINDIKKQQELVLGEVIGVTKNTLDGSYENVRKKETNLGNLISDILLDKTKADISMYNGGNIRDTIQKGNITKRNVVAVLPFSNTIITKELTGNQIKEILEHGVKVYPEKNSAFLQVGGISYCFDPNQKNGEKITSIIKDGNSLDMDRKYTVATNDYIALGGDEFPCFAKEPIVKDFGELEEAVVDYIQYKKEIYKNTEGRINIRAKENMCEEEKNLELNNDEDYINSDNNKDYINSNKVENKKKDNKKSFERDISINKEASNIKPTKTIIKEKSPKTGDIGVDNNVFILISSAILIYLFNLKEKKKKI